jgi:RHS repeat-associated protein
VAATNASSNSGALSVTKLILKDHLGSMVAEIALTGTGAAPSVNATTLAVHGFGPWGNARNGLNADQRGFTGHEHLAELGLIHMNGRIYDPVIGRFLQADPIIQAPHNAQSHNRYSYVMNNPLSMADPSGFSWWTRFRSRVVGAVTWVATMVLSGGNAQLATYLSNAVRAGMDAHAAGRNVWRALGASVAGTAVSRFGPLVAAAVENLADGGNVRSALKSVFSAGLVEQFGPLIGGCAAGRVSGGGCGSGIVDAVVSAGIQAAQTGAYQYLVSAQTANLQRAPGAREAIDPPLQKDAVESYAKFDRTVDWVRSNFPELLPEGTTISVAGERTDRYLRTVGALGISIGQDNYVAREYLSPNAQELMMTDTVVHELLHSYVDRQIGTAVYLWNQVNPFRSVDLHDWVAQTGIRLAAWRYAGDPRQAPPPRPAFALPDPYRRKD